MKTTDIDTRIGTLSFTHDFANGYPDGSGKQQNLADLFWSVTTSFIALGLARSRRPG